MQSDVCYKHFFYCITITDITDGSLGTWQILLYSEKDSEFTDSLMTTVSMGSSCSGDLQAFECHACRYDGYMMTAIGKCDPTKDSNLFTVAFRLWRDKNATNIHYYKGQLDIRNNTVIGTWGWSENPSTHEGLFILKKTSPEILRFYPAPCFIARNKARAMWSFATSSVLNQIRRRLWTWSYFRERGNNRRRYLSLALRDDGYGNGLSNSESNELSHLRQLLTYRDACFYHLLFRREERRLALEQASSSLR